MMMANKSGKSAKTTVKIGTTGAAIVLIDARIAATIVPSDTKSAVDTGMDTVAIVNIAVAIAATATVTTTRTTCSSCSFANFLAVIRKVGGFICGIT